MFQRAAPLGYQQLTLSSTATGLTLPYGSQQASGSACNLLGKTLTVGGTVTGTFAVGQTVVGTGIPANTTIVGQGGPGSNTWQLSAACTTETGEAVTAYQTLNVNFAEIRVSTANANWRDDGTAPTASVGMPMLSTDPLFEYAGALQNIQFIAQTGSPVLNVSYYSLSG
jgi:hypothetical protein